jgi:hypothetical protein
VFAFACEDRSTTVIAAAPLLAQSGGFAGARRPLIFIRGPGAPFASTPGSLAVTARRRTGERASDALAVLSAAGGLAGMRS